MPKLERPGRRSQEPENSQNLHTKQGFSGFEHDLTAPTESFRRLNLTDASGRQDQDEYSANAWTESNYGGRQPYFEGHLSSAKYNPSIDTSRTSSSSYSSLPIAPQTPFDRVDDSISSKGPFDPASGIESNGFTYDENIDEPPSYEASIASSSVSGRRHLNDGSYNSISSSTSAWDTSAIDMKGSNHRRETADTNPSTRAPSPAEDQGELLPYLQDSYEDTNGLRNRGEDEEQRPSSMVMPNAIPQLPPDMLRPYRPPPDANHTTITPPPPASRTVSEPPSAPALERPPLPPRGMTISPRFPGTADLDRIDELDETTPHGYTLHHRGPYEYQGSMATPPGRKMEIRNGERFQRPPQVLVEDASFSQPPVPLPFKLNLQPGGVLTRLPPTGGNVRYSIAAPRQRAPLAPIVPYAISQRATTGSHPIYGNMQPEPREAPYGYEEPRYQQADETAMQYGNQMYAPRRTSSVETTLQAQWSNSRNGFPASSANSSRSDFRAYPNLPAASDSNYLPADERRESSPGRSIPQQDKAYGMPHRGYVPSQFSPQPTFSSSSSTLSRADTSWSRLDDGARPVDLHRPKHLVMPAPLQQQGTDNRLPNPYSPNPFLSTSQPNVVDSVPAPKPSAATIPVHDPRKGNLLKKRLSKSASPHEGHQHLAPVRMPESNNNSVISFGRGLEPEPELKVKKSGRKLSKRRGPI